MVCGVGGYTASGGFHPFRFGCMNPRSWRDAHKWGASSLAWHSCQVKPCEWVCGESLYEVNIACCSNKILSYSPLTYTLGYSRGGVRDNLTHCVHLKRKLKLLLGFDSLPSMWRCAMRVCLCYVLVLIVSVGWYSRCNDTWLLFTWQFGHNELLRLLSLVNLFFIQVPIIHTIFHYGIVRMQNISNLVAVTGGQCVKS